MKILVPIKRVPDPYGRIRPTGDGLLDESDIKWVVNPFDEIALEEAVRIRESGGNVEIVAVTVGPQIWEEQLRTALAMGADRGIHVVDDQPSDPSIVSTMLSAIVKRESPNIVLMGKQAIDDDASQTGQMLGALVDLPQVSFASKIEISPTGDSATVTREIDSGRETLRVKLPAVITADLRLNEPRYVALPAIIKARSKPIQRIEASELGVRPTSRIRILKLESPPPRKPGRRVGSVQELITALREEAGVI
jgi:electron transfer flavoprotein beta subunit